MINVELGTVFEIVKHFLLKPLLENIIYYTIGLGITIRNVVLYLQCRYSIYYNKQLSILKYYKKLYKKITELTCYSHAWSSRVFTLHEQSPLTHEVSHRLLCYRL